jgi:hypothetical protein
MRPRRIVLISVASIVIIAVIIEVYLTGSKMSAALNENIGFDGTASREYKDLFEKDAQDKLNDYITHLSKVRNPVSFLTYDQQYLIAEYKIDLSGDTPLRENVTETVGRVKETPGIVYSEYDMKDFTMNYKSGAIVPVSKVYITFTQPGKAIIRNDSVIYYYLEKGDFSLRYGKDSAVDFDLESKDSFLGAESSPKALLLIRRDRAVFFVQVTAKDKTVMVPKDLVYRLVPDIK